VIDGLVKAEDKEQMCVSGLKSLNTLKAEGKISVEEKTELHIKLWEKVFFN
jgi:hypothetical protein